MSEDAGQPAGEIAQRAAHAVTTTIIDSETRFAEAAAINYDRASHFAIFPTVLQVMGYPLGFVRETFGEDLLSQINTQQAFTSGEVFGLFADVNWNPVDVHARYLEQSFTAGSVECRPNR